MGRRKKNLIVADMSVNGEGGGATPCPQLNSFIFISQRRKDAECSETYKYGFGRISSYFEFLPTQSYVLNHSESIDMLIEK